VVPGVDRRRQGANASLGDVIGPSFAAADMPDVVGEAHRDLPRRAPRGRALRGHRASRRHPAFKQRVYGARAARPTTPLSEAA
jgi:hypothetical protein